MPPPKLTEVAAQGHTLDVAKPAPKTASFAGKVAEKAAAKPAKPKSPRSRAGSKEKTLLTLENMKDLKNDLDLYASALHPTVFKDDNDLVFFEESVVAFVLSEDQSRAEAKRHKAADNYKTYNAKFSDYAGVFKAVVAEIAKLKTKDGPLAQDLATYQNHLVPDPLSQKQFDALTDFVAKRQAYEQGRTDENKRAAVAALKVADELRTSIKQAKTAVDKVKKAIGKQTQDSAAKAKLREQLKRLGLLEAERQKDGTTAEQANAKGQDDYFIDWCLRPSVKPKPKDPPAKPWFTDQKAKADPIYNSWTKHHFDDQYALTKLVNSINPREQVIAFAEFEAERAKGNNPFEMSTTILTGILDKAVTKWATADKATWINVLSITSTNAKPVLLRKRKTLKDNSNQNFHLSLHPEGNDAAFEVPGAADVLGMTGAELVEKVFGNPKESFTRRLHVAVEIGDQRASPNNPHVYFTKAAEVSASYSGKTAVKTKDSPGYKGGTYTKNKNDYFYNNFQAAGAKEDELYGHAQAFMQEVVKALAAKMDAIKAKGSANAVKSTDAKTKIDPIDWKEDVKWGANP